METSEATAERWTTARKAAVLDRISRGEITREYAMRRYQISAGEMLSMETAYRDHGQAGLRATRVQRYRHG